MGKLTIKLSSFFKEFNRDKVKAMADPQMKWLHLATTVAMNYCRMRGIQDNSDYVSEAQLQVLRLIKQPTFLAIKNEKEKIDFVSSSIYHLVGRFSRLNYLVPVTIYAFDQGVRPPAHVPGLEQDLTMDREEYNEDNFITDRDSKRAYNDVFGDDYRGFRRVQKPEQEEALEFKEFCSTLNKEELELLKAIMEFGMGFARTTQCGFDRNLKNLKKKWISYYVDS